MNPKYIIDINWTSQWESLYKIWTKKHLKSQFIVVQHGSYVGGIVIDNSHKYTKCDIFLTWSDYFKNSFKELNSGKKTRFITFGNPVYNNFDRDSFSYKKKERGKILFVPSAIFEDRLCFYNDVFKKLKELGFNIFVKEHNIQGVKKKIGGKEVYFPPIKNINKVEGNLADILNNNDFELIISDHSTALLDSIFFKNEVLYFAPDYLNEEYALNEFSKYLKNLFHEYKALKTKADLYNCIDIDKQEKLLESLVYNGDNVLGNI